MTVIAALINTQATCPGSSDPHQTPSYKPSPKHSGQAPNGLLKEKLRGSTSSTLIPQSGQAKPSGHHEVLTVDDIHHRLIPRSGCRIFSIESVRRFSMPCFDNQTVYNDLDIVLDILLQNDILRQIIQIAIHRSHAHSHSFLPWSSSFSCVPFRPRTTGAKKLDLRTFRQCHDLIYHLINGLLAGSPCPHFGQ